MTYETALASAKAPIEGLLRFSDEQTFKQVMAICDSAFQAGADWGLVRGGEIACEAIRKARQRSGEGSHAPQEAAKAN